MSLRSVIVAWLAVTAISAVPARASDSDLRAGNLPPRIGQISDEVAVQRLKEAGVQKPKITLRESGRIVAEGLLDGKQTTFHIDALRGDVVDAENPNHILVGPGSALAPSAVTGPLLKQERIELSNPALMTGAVRAPE